MPEFDVFFILLPTQKDFSSADDRRKIDQSAIQIFDLDFAPLKFQQDLLDISHDLHPSIHQRAADITAWLHQGLHLFVVFFQHASQIHHLFKPLPDLREQSPGLIERVVLIKTISHNRTDKLPEAEYQCSPFALDSTFLRTSSLASRERDLRHASRAFSGCLSAA